MIDQALAKRATAYLNAVYAPRKVYHRDECFYMLSAPDARGGQYESQVAYISSPHNIPAIIDCTGDSDRIMKYLA